MNDYRGYSYNSQTARERARVRARAKKQKQINTIKTIFLFCFCFFILISVFVLKNNETKRNYHYEMTTSYIVSKGETIWTIANEFSDNRHDTRKVVWEIQQLSNTTALIFPGQELIIPLYTVMDNGQ